MSAHGASMAILAGYRPFTGAPDQRMLDRAAALREAAEEVALDLGLTPAFQRARIAELLREHEALTLRAQAAHHLAHGEPSLARHYVASARRLDGRA